MKKLIANFKAFIQQIQSKTPEKIGKILLREALQISSAESCTGGLVSSRLTDVSGSSAYVRMNFITYSNEAKQKILNVSSETLEKYGVVEVKEIKYNTYRASRNLKDRDIYVSEYLFKLKKNR